MKKGLVIIIAHLLCFSMLTGCAGTEGDEQNIEPSSTLDENALAFYGKLISFKADDYAQQSVQDFNVRLLPEYAELLEANAAVMAAGLSDEDENYDFIAVTLRASLGELYAEKMDEKAFFSGHADKGRLSEPLNKTEETIFEAAGPSNDFWLSAEYYLEYEILSPNTLTIAERDNTFHIFENELQVYVDGLIETELDNTITKELNDRAAAILQEITPDGMTISCEIKVSSGNEELLLDAYFSDEEYQKLRALQFDGYEDMRVSEFQNKVWTLTDTDEYRDLLDRFSTSRTFYGKKDYDETSYFYFYVLQPLIAERWELWAFSDTITPDDPALSYRTFLEYVLTLNITNADILTVREYNSTRLVTIQALQDFINSKTEEELRNCSVMEKAIGNEIEKIRQRLSIDAIQIDVEYSFMPLDWYYENVSDGSVERKQEIRQTSYGTKEDYASLLALKTPDYENMSVADFDLKLLDWANEDYERMGRIDADYAWNDYRVKLSDDELSFVRLTICLSGQENGKYVQSQYTGKPEKDPIYDEYLSQRIADGENHLTAWCDLYYQFTYHIADKKAMTVGERDDCVGGMIHAIQEFWNETTMDDILKMSKRDIVLQLTSLAAEYSNDKIAITITSDRVYFEKTDEKAAAFAMFIQANNNLSLEEKDRMLDAQNAAILSELTIGSYVNPQDGRTYYSFDGGKTSEPLIDEEFEQRFPTPDVEWWTYDEYKAWLEDQKVQLPDMIGETGRTSSQGEFVWTQEKVDETIKMYEDILEEIRNGVLYSKSVDGNEDGSFSMTINYEDIKMGSSSRKLSLTVKLLDGEEVTFGPYATEDELLAEVEPFCKEQVTNKRMTQTEADEILERYRNGSYF